MNRRLFLKALAVSPIVPSVLCAKEKPRVTLTLHAGTDREETHEWKPLCDYMWKNGEVDCHTAFSEKDSVIYQYIPTSEYKEHPERVPHNTHIHPSFNSAHELVGYFWNTEEIGKV